MIWCKDVVAHLKAPTRGVSLEWKACRAYVFYNVLALRKSVCRSGRLRGFLSVHTEDFVKGYFHTPVWSPGANLQRLVGCFYHRWLLRVNYRRELLVLSDRAWWHSTGSTRTDRAASAGHGAVCFPRSLLSASPRQRVCRSVSQERKRYPRKCPLAAGVSLGGLLLSHQLCQRSPHTQPDVPLVVLRAFEPAEAARTVSNSWCCSLLSNVCSTRGLVGRLRDSEEVVRVARVIRANDVFRCWTPPSFDPHCAAPAFGFQSVQDFYDNCS
ncbi:uncharacterized protein LOC144097682 [Amblyomma americanum]